MIGQYTINIPEIFQVFTVSEFDSNSDGGKHVLAMFLNYELF